MKSMKKKRLALATAAAALLSVSALAVTPLPAQAATGAYGSTKSCRLSNGSGTVYIAPHFQVENSNGFVYRHLDGYSFYTSPARWIVYVRETAVWFNGEFLGQTTTSPYYYNGSRTDLYGKYVGTEAGKGIAKFTVRDSYGASCSVDVNY